MKKSAKKLRKALMIIGIVLLTLSILSVSFYQIDKHRVETDKRPIFSYGLSLADGGTTYYYGLGYQIIRWNRIAEKDDVYGHRTGTESHYLLSFKGLQGEPDPDTVKFVKQENYIEE